MIFDGSGTTTSLKPSTETASAQNSKLNPKKPDRIAVRERHVQMQCVCDEEVIDLRKLNTETYPGAGIAPEDDVVDREGGEIDNDVERVRSGVAGCCWCEQQRGHGRSGQQSTR